MGLECTHVVLNKRPKSMNYTSMFLGSEVKLCFKVDMPTSITYPNRTPIYQVCIQEWTTTTNEFKGIGLRAQNMLPL